ncbi:MAG: pyridine nucleotide-disulfide oxidoreductase [Rhodospirillaceae bacterium]|nr:MAG: pyridine nucleotide-disulfide oxidoreductase [Rhodospirillaceae bacterium]
MAANTHHGVLIIGGGAAGITVAASLRKRAPRPIDIAIVEPSEFHYYQPAFTLVGAGAYSLAKTRRREVTLIPPGVTWIQDPAQKFEPEQNRVTLKSGDCLTYDYLVVCTGVELNWEKIDGLAETLGKNGVCSNYAADQAEYTWACLQSLKAGAKALFTQAPLPFKCPGAPQKIAYLAADHLRRKGLLKGCDLHFLTHAPAIFGVPFFARELVKVADHYGIHVHYQHNLIAVDGVAKKATFEIVGGDTPGKKVTMDFDMLHVTPPQSPPEVIRSSPLANKAGWVDVDKNTLQHTRYENVFSLGDVASTPNSKTAAAVRKQAPVVVRNLLHKMSNADLQPDYDGYASCPLTTAYGKAILAEFIYGGKVTPTLPLNPGRERWTIWWIKTTGLPIMYWRYMLKGYEWFLPHNTKWPGDAT